MKRARDFVSMAWFSYLASLWVLFFFSVDMFGSECEFIAHSERGIFDSQAKMINGQIINEEGGNPLPLDSEWAAPSYGGQNFEKKKKTGQAFHHPNILGLDLYFIRINVDRSWCGPCGLRNIRTRFQIFNLRSRTVISSQFSLVPIHEERDLEIWGRKPTLFEPKLPNLIILAAHN